MGLLAGCGARSSVPAEGESAAVAVPQFSAKKGLLLPDTTRQALGLKMAEVTERKIASALEVSLRVYQVAGGVGLASGMVAPEQAKRLQKGQAVEIRVGEKAVTGKVVRVSDELQRGDRTRGSARRNPRGRRGVAGGRVRSSPGAGGVGRERGDDPARCIAGMQRGAVSSIRSAASIWFGRTVKVGASNKDWVEITDGLYAGDQVVAQPVMSLWMTELAAVKGGQACCVEPPKGK